MRLSISSIIYWLFALGFICLVLATPYYVFDKPVEVATARAAMMGPVTGAEVAQIVRQIVEPQIEKVLSLMVFLLLVPVLIDLYRHPPRRGRSTFRGEKRRSINQPGG